MKGQARCIRPCNASATIHYMPKYVSGAGHPEVHWFARCQHTSPVSSATRMMNMTTSLLPPAVSSAATTCTFKSDRVHMCAHKTPSEQQSVRNNSLVELSIAMHVLKRAIWHVHTKQYQP